MDTNTLAQALRKAQLARKNASQSLRKAQEALQDARRRVDSLQAARRAADAGDMDSARKLYMEAERLEGLLDSLQAD